MKSMASSGKDQNFRPNMGNIAKRRPNQTSLLASPPASPVSTTSPPSTSKTRTLLFRAGRNDSSYFLDVSYRSETESSLFQTILQQYPSCRGAAPFKDNGKRYIEVNFDPSDMIINHIFQTDGIYFADNQQIAPFRALPDGSNLKRIALSRMPFLSKTMKSKQRGRMLTGFCLDYLYTLQWIETMLNETLA